MKASEIDWSKAPEWATGYGFAGMHNVAVWVSDDCYTYVDGQQQGRVFSIMHGEGWSLDEIRVVSSRPSAWNGTGLPLVGTVCEYKLQESLDDAYDPPRRVTVFGVDGDYAAIRCDAFRCWVPVDHLRPIRTPEQIAEEEREKAIDEIARIAWTGVEAGLSMFAAIYDAGYRKVEGGEV